MGPGKVRPPTIFLIIISQRASTYFCFLFPFLKICSFFNSNVEKKISSVSHCKWFLVSYKKKEKRERLKTEIKNSPLDKRRIKRTRK